MQPPPAGAVVTRDVPNYAVVYGAPATVRSWICNCGLTLDLSLDTDSEENCECRCGQSYQKLGQTVRETVS